MDASFVIDLVFVDIFDVKSKVQRLDTSRYSGVDSGYLNHGGVLERWAV